MQLQDELAQLKSELALLRNQQTDTQKNYQQNLDDFSIKLDNLSQLVAQSDSHQQNTSTLAQKPVQTIEDFGLLANNGQLALQANMPGDFNVESNNDNKTNTNTTLNLGKKLTAQFNELLLPSLALLLSKITSFYSHYQQRGLAAVFLMTLAGIITLTLGFTYLLQYSFNHWLSDIGKVLLAFISANTLLALGVYIYKRRAQMQEFASALVGLGLIINYLSAYFSGPYFHIISDWLSLLLLLCISLFGFFLSFKFKTKVVAILSLVGGSLAPVMLFNETNNQLIYLPYLLLIGSCALVQSRLLRWPLLIEITALLHITCVELFIVAQALYFEQLSILPIMCLLSINLMFYLYGFSGLYYLKNTLTKQSRLNKRLLVLPVALFAFTLLSMMQLSHYSGYIFLFNALLLVIVYATIKNQPALKVLSLLLAASFLGFAALQLLKQDLLGLVLFAEGLALLYLGTKEHYQSIRFEAYLLIILALLTHFTTLSQMLDLTSTGLNNSHQYGFILLFLSLSSATLYGVVSLVKKVITTENNNPVEGKMFTFFRECLNIHYVCLILYSATIINAEHAVNSLPLISMLLLYLARKEQLKFSESLAWLLLLPLVATIVFAVLETNSLRFSVQPLVAQLASIALFSCCVGFYYWYKSYYQQSTWTKLAYYLQILCYSILPLLFLPKVVRLYPEFLSLAICLSVLMSLALAFISRNKWLFLQAKLLTVSAILFIIMDCLQGLWQGLLALGFVAFLLAYLHNNYLKLSALSRLLLRFQWLLSPYYFALVIAVIVHTLMSLIGLENWGITMATLVIYFAWLLTLTPRPLVLRKSYQSCAFLMLLATIAPLLLHVNHGLTLTIDSLLFMIAQLAILATLWAILNANGVVIRLFARRLSRLYMHWAWHLLLSVSYLLWSYQFSHLIAAPLSTILVVIHASRLMFISLQPDHTNSIKLAAAFFMLACSKVLLVDMGNFLIIQKVIAFMLIGAILLAVSYFYQRVKNQQIISQSR